MLMTFLREDLEVTDGSLLAEGIVVFRQALNRS
jgi:hypothetical protein